MLACNSLVPRSGAEGSFRPMVRPMFFKGCTVSSLLAALKDHMGRSSAVVHLDVRGKVFRDGCRIDYPSSQCT